ncbi:SCO family protein [Polaromonas sp. SM01]|uniref:SCO family protein n=1 Tax=Polaromonas sp. SM01 TaxID=3085630 RepID=UPI002980D3E2|nr:SCO family protein [Polaromonas sp. SM01]MDW5442107.1 SCO family protein [Polaromonas sp. SM01]
MSFFSTPLSKRNAIRLIAGGALWTGAAAILSACTEVKPQFASIDITGADYARDFALADHNGQPRSIKDFQGKVVVMFFGYTQCPDVCPTSMAELADIKKMLGADGDKLQGLFVTLDPERDTQAVLKAYMGNFDPTFLALRPELDQLPQLSKDFKTFYKKVEGKTPGSYTLDHSAGSYIFDPQGRVRLYSRYGSGATLLAGDIRLLLKGN